MAEPTFTMTAGPGSAPVPLEGDWGPFQLIEKVGEGSFGEVYRAYDTTLQREVALKLLLPAALDRDSQAQAMLKEARAIARVRHPNVVSVYGVETYNDRVGFWSDFVNGKTLSAIVRADGPFSAKEAALIGIDLCKAVGAVHAAGLLHRDIKCGNAMRESGGRILLLDFGLTHEHGTPSRMVGTALYMAPEILNGQPASIASDIYALGILLFHLLTGRYPVSGDTFTAVVSSHSDGSRLTLLDMRPDLPEALARVVEIAANPDPAKRYQSTGQMIAALSDAMGQSQPSPAAPPAHRNYLLWGALTFAALAASLTLAVPSLRNAIVPHDPGAAPISSVHDDYQKAHTLLEHYYRPQALETAIPLLQKTTAKDPAFAPAFADLGRANLLQFIHLRDTKFIEPTRQASLRALSIMPTLASAHVTLGTLYFWTGKADLASQELDQALKMDKYNAEAYAALGSLLVSQGRNSEAEAMMQKAVSLAPENWSILDRLGSYYDEAGKYAQAAEQYQRAADLAPDNPRAQNNLGYINRLRNRVPQAEAAYRKSIALEPTAGHYRNLGQLLLEQANFTEAKVALENAVKRKPDDYRSWGFLAVVYSYTGVSPAKVEETYRKAISLAEDLARQTQNAYVIADLGNYYAALGKPQQSEPLLRQAAALHPDSAELLYEVAKGYELLHNRNQALLWIGKAVSAGMPPGFLARVPQLSALRADPLYKKAIDPVVTKQ